MGFARNQLWCQIVALACELIAWTQMLALTVTARRWEPKRLRLPVFALASRLASSGRRLRLRLAGRWPWAAQLIAAATRLQAISPNSPDGQEGETTRARGTPPTGAIAGRPRTTAR